MVSMVPRGPPWSPVVPRGPPRSPVVAVRKATWSLCGRRRCAEGDVLLAVPLGICETPHDLRPEHAALPALLVAARAGDGYAGGGGGGGLRFFKAKKKERKQRRKIYPMTGSNSTLENRTWRLYTN